MPSGIYFGKHHCQKGLFCYIFSKNFFHFKMIHLYSHSFLGQTPERTPTKQTMTCTANGLTSTKSIRIKQLRTTFAAESYITHSEKERKCAGQVEAFQTDFVKNHPEIKVRASFLQPLNEYNIRKFACTAIQPTLIPNKELYDLCECCNFVARFVSYEPLENEAEAALVSPTQTISWAVGDAFDMSVLLVSLLIGAGYGAYVVLGTAPGYIRFKDQSHMHCTLVDVENNKDPLKPWSVRVTVRDDCPVNKKANDLGIHYWVQVKAGKRDLPFESCFVEPSTGVIYPLEKETPYNEIWCIFNDKNYWISTSPGDIDTDHSWLQVLPSIAPFSYVLRVEIPPKMLALQYPPTGKVQFLFDKTKIEYFGDSIDAQGIVTRITQFQDEEHVIVVQITELFGPKTRSDKLIERVRRPLDMSCDEKYSITNAQFIRERSESVSLQSLKFHPKTRYDGMIEHIEDVGKLITAYFQGRSDSLIRKVVSLRMLHSTAEKPKHRNVLACGNGLGFAEIIRVDDFYEQPIDKSLMKTSVANRSFQPVEKQIVVTYHCEHEALQVQSIYSKEDILDSDSKRHTLLKLESESILASKKFYEEFLEMREAAYHNDLRLSNTVMNKSSEDDMVPTAATPNENIDS